MLDFNCSHAGGCEGRPARGRGLAAVLRVCSGQAEDLGDGAKLYRLNMIEYWNYLF